MSDTETIIKERAEARARLELIKPHKNNPVAEFFSSSNTPETDAKASPHIGFYSCATVPAEFARKLERERDEAREALSGRTVSCAACNHAAIERDEAREKAERYRLEANAMMLQRDEAQKHLRDIEEYGTEEINAAVELRQKLADALLERDEAREELAEAKRESENLARSIYRTEYSDNDTGWELLESVAGVISQIDNMYAGVREQRDEAREDATNYFAKIGELERERDEAREDLKITQDAWVKAKAERVKALRERDEAREERDRYKQQLEDSLMETVEAAQ